MANIENILKFNIFQPREDLDGYTMGSLITKDEKLFTEWNEGAQNHSQSLIQSLKLSSDDLEEIKLMIRGEKDVQLEPDFKNIIHHCCYKDNKKEKEKEKEKENTK